MRHPEPFRWADAAAGRLSDDEVAALDRHADECSRFTSARERILRASGSFPALR